MATSSILNEFTIKGEQDITRFLNSIEESERDNISINEISAKQIKNKEELLKLFDGNTTKAAH